MTYDILTYPVLIPLSKGYPEHLDRLSTRYSPVRHFTRIPKNPFSFDLHVLSTPPTFVLSQDQTLQFYILTNHLTSKKFKDWTSTNKKP